MKRLLFSAFIMLFAGGLFAQVNFVSTDNVSPQVHADKVIKDIQSDLALNDSQIKDIRSVTADGTAAVQRMAGLKASNPAKYQEQLDHLVKEIDAKIYSLLEGRQKQIFQDLIGRSISTEAGKG